MLNILKNTINRVFASGVDSDAYAFITATGLSGTTQKSAITTLVKDLKSSGLWSKMKAVYPMVTDNVNQLQYTTTFNSTYYRTDGTSTITANYTTAPDGTNTAARMLGNTASSYMYYNINDGLGSGNRTYSIYLKAGSDTNVLLTFNSDGTTVSQSVTLTSSWQRFQLTKNITNSSSGFYITVENVGSGLDLFMWGVQVEFGTTASTYQPIATTPSAFMASQMKYNLKDARDLDAAFRLTWSGGWTYSATGATPNGTNAYADTKFIPSSNLTINDQSYSVYSRSNTAAGNKRELGINYLGDVGVIVRYTGDLFYPAIGSGSYPNVTNTDSRGLFVADRTDGTNVKGYKNGSLVVNSAQIPQLLTTYSAYIGARNSNGAANDFSDRQLAFVHLGQGLTDQDNMLLNQIVEKYQVALSRGVQAAQSFYYNSAYSNEANTYLYSTQITGTTQVSAINTLINSLKANNLWSKMKAVYPFVTDKWNMLSYTEDFTNAVWGKTNVTATLTGTYNNSNYFKIADSVNGSNIFLFNFSNIITATTYTVSANFKKGEYDYVQMHYSGSPGAVFNLANGTIVGSVATNTTISDIGNGWYRCTITYTASGSAIYFSPNKTSTSGYNYSGTIGSGIYMQSPQLEIGTSASTYQPVLGANNYSANVSAQMKFNLVNPQDSDAAFRLAFSGGWTYSTNGAQPNGTNGYADTKLVPSTSIASINSAHISFYSRTNSDSNCDIGAATAVPTAAFQVWPKQSNLRYIRVFSNFTPESTTESTAAFYLNSRLNSTNITGYRNGVVLSTLALSSISTITNSIVISARSDGGTVSNYSNRQTAFATIGDGLTDAEALILYNLIQQYQTDLSRQV